MPVTAPPTFKPAVYGITLGAAGTVLTSNGLTAATPPTFQAAGGGGPSPANPSGLIGLTAVNGVAATYDRSDSTHALDQSIAPTWTGAHIFTNAIPISIQSTTPRIVFNETDGGADAKQWDETIAAGIWALRTRTDADGAGVNAITVTRGAGTAITNISLGNATNNPTGTWLGSGTFTFNGSTVTGVSSTAARFIVTASTLPSNGIYLAAANMVGISANTAARVLVDANGTGVQLGGITAVAAARAMVGGVDYQNVTQTGNTAATQTDAFSHTIAANTLNTTGETLEFEAAGTFAATASVDKRITVVLGTTTIFDTGPLAITGASSWRISGTIIRTGASAGKCVVDFEGSFAGTPAFPLYTAITETLTNALTLKLTLNGTNANDTVAEFYKEKWFPKL